MNGITLTLTADEACLLLRQYPALAQRIAEAALGGTASPPAAKPKATKPKATKPKAKAPPKSKQPKSEAGPAKPRRPRSSKAAIMDAAADVLARMKSDASYSASQLRAATGFDQQKLTGALALLMKAQKINRSGEKRGTLYSIAKQASDA